MWRQKYFLKFHSFLDFENNSVVPLSICIYSFKTEKYIYLVREDIHDLRIKYPKNKYLKNVILNISNEAKFIPLSDFKEEILYFAYEMRYVEFHSHCGSLDFIALSVIMGCSHDQQSEDNPWPFEPYFLEMAKLPRGRLLVYRDFKLSEKDKYNSLKFCLWLNEIYKKLHKYQYRKLRGINYYMRKKELKNK